MPLSHGGPLNNALCIQVQCEAAHSRLQLAQGQAAGLQQQLEAKQTLAAADAEAAEEAQILRQVSTVIYVYMSKCLCRCHVDHPRHLHVTCTTDMQPHR